MNDPTLKSNEERRHEERKVWRTALLVSVLIHLLILILGPVGHVVISPFAAAGPRAGDDRAAAGSMQALNITTPPTVPLVPPPVPLPIEVEIEPVEFDEEVAVEPSSLLGNLPGPLEGPGLEDGDGEGDGGTADEGLFRLVPPVPRGMIIPPESDEFKGRTVEIWLFVDANGRVVPDSTHIRPPTSDRDLNRRLIREAAEWLFKPATKGGENVATWFPYRISM